MDQSGCHGRKQKTLNQKGLVFALHLVLDLIPVQISVPVWVFILVFVIHAAMWPSRISQWPESPCRKSSLVDIGGLLSGTLMRMGFWDVSL